MSSNLRIRIKFDSTPLNHSQKCWFTFDGEKCKMVSDVRHLIASRFNMKPQGIQLYMDDFLIPTNESAKVIRDNDVLQVKSVGSIQEDSSSSSDESSSSEEDTSQPKAKHAKVEPKPKQAAKLKQESTKPKAATASVKQKASTTTKKGATKSSAASTLAAKKLVGVTTQSTTGALHTKFQSSSSSSDTSSSSSSSGSSSEDDGKKPGIGAKNKGKGVGTLKGGTQWDKKGPWSTPGNVRGGNSARGWNRNRTGRNICPDLVVGGPSDVLTTRSKVYSRGRGRISTARTRESLQMVVNAVQETLSKQGLNKPAPSQSPPYSHPPLETASDAQESLVEPPVPEVEEEPAPDYSACDNLNGPPREGDNLAFKVLELSSTYTPEVSEFKEGTVIGYDSSTTMVKVKFSASCLKRLAKKADAEEGGTDKFAVSDEEEKDSILSQEQSSEIQLKLEELIEPKLLTCSPTDKNT